MNHGTPGLPWGPAGNTGEEMKRWALKVEVLLRGGRCSPAPPAHCSQGCEQGFLSNPEDSHCWHLACHEPYEQSYKNSLTDFSPDTESMQSLD